MELWKRKFIIIWSGQLFSILSSAIVGYSLMFWLSIETRSAEVLAYAVFATLLPQALLGPVVGVYVDRWKRKTTMITADGFVVFVSLTSIGGVSAIFYNSPFTSILQTHIEHTALGCVFSLFGSLSLLPSLVGILATGFIADTIGVANAFLISGSVILLLGIISFFIPSVMKLEKR